MEKSWELLFSEFTNSAGGSGWLSQVFHTEGILYGEDLVGVHKCD